MAIAGQHLVVGRTGRNSRHDLLGMLRQSVSDRLAGCEDVIDSVHDRRSPRSIVLNMDSSFSPTHGEQEGAAYNGHFACTCCNPLFVFNQFGDLECSALAGRPHRPPMASPQPDGVIHFILFYKFIGSEFVGGNVGAKLYQEPRNDQHQRPDRMAVILRARRLGGDREGGARDHRAAGGRPERLANRARHAEKRDAARPVRPRR
ncbi:MAG: hypothetical protein FJX20_01675 [Alphaproteobacteria bacterium]|nr:hypothetical protein [Alphaproteobacteria bacterium]